MTSLGIGDVRPDRPKLPQRQSATCPKCGSKERETVDSFGSTAKRVMCGMCAYEFKESV
jgi:transcription elongation factor Elf1